jgi:xylulokinase
VDELLLGIDVGTTNVKAVLATPDGEVVARAQKGHPTRRPRPGWAEQDPADWWDGVVATTHEALEASSADKSRVAGVGVSGQGCAVTLVDGSGEVMRPAITGSDSRSEPQCRALRGCCGEEILRVNGKEPAPYNADPVLMWLAQHEPDSIEAARCSLTTTGYLNYRLTGEPVENVSDASILFAFDLQAGGWSDALIEDFGLPRKLYPPVAPCSEVIGGLTRAAAKTLGLEAGTPVVAGGEDTSSAGLAVGAVEPGQALLSLGTAGTVYVAQDRLAVRPRLLTFLHVLESRSLLGGSMAAAGAALAWCREILGREFDFCALTGLAEESEPGADGVIFLPYLSGELQPINDGNARGVLFGLSLSTGRRELVRAVMEGAAFAIAHNLRLIEEAGAPVEELRAVGGPTRSPLWCQIIADVCGRDLAVLADDAGAPLGDALLAAAGADLIEDPAATAARAAGVARRHEPRAEHRERYARLFEVYRELYPNLKEQFAAAAALEDANGGAG